MIVLRALGILVVLGGAAGTSDLTRGVGAMFLFFLLLVVVVHLVLTRTRWGRSVYAVGGNVEAARRAGIRVNRVYISVFVLCSTLAALGGILAAARLGAANQSSGGGDINLNAIAAAVIGGTSLFGGRGSAFSALLGIVVIKSISSGLTLLNLDPSSATWSPARCCCSPSSSTRCRAGRARPAGWRRPGASRPPGRALQPRELRQLVVLAAALVAVERVDLDGRAPPHAL